MKKYKNKENMNKREKHPLEVGLIDLYLHHYQFFFPMPLPLRI